MNHNIQAKLLVQNLDNCQLHFLIFRTLRQHQYRCPLASVNNIDKYFCLSHFSIDYLLLLFF